MLEINKKRLTEKAGLIVIILVFNFMVIFQIEQSMDTTYNTIVFSLLFIAGMIMYFGVDFKKIKVKVK